MQTYLRTANRIITMDNRIDNRFEDRMKRILRNVNSSRNLNCRNLHIPLDKCTGLCNLPVNRPDDVTGIQLLISVPHLTTIANRLDKSAWQVALRILARSEQSSYRRMLLAILTTNQKMKLTEKLGVVGRRKNRSQPVEQTSDKGIPWRTRHDLFVKTNDSRLATLLEKPRQRLRRNLSFRATHPSVITVPTLVHEKA